MASTDLLIIITQFEFAGVPKIIIQVSHPKNDIYFVSENSYMSNMELDLENIAKGTTDPGVDYFNQ